MSDIAGPHAFVLGCERSGSTWVSNVLDAHPGIEFYMEPFADYAGLFPGFPDRNTYIGDQSTSLAAVLRKGYSELSRSKYLLAYAPGRSPNWKRLDRFLISVHTSLAKLLRHQPATSVRRFELLSLNQKKVPVWQQVRKDKDCSLQVTKELRLNFKIGLFRKVFPEAKFVVVVRHPGAQVSSILKMFEAGHLGELKRSLPGFFACLGNSRRFDQYADVCRHLANKEISAEVLLWWWLVNYQTSIEDCKRHNADYMVVFHEDLSASPDDEYQRICSFLGIDYTEDVRDYVQRSSAPPGRARDSASGSPLDTVRDSSSYSRDAIASISDDIRQGIRGLFDSFDVCEDLGRYRRTPESN